jgi:SPOR domain
MYLARVLTIALAAMGPVAAAAQSGELALPAEFPPTSYTSNQYVDSTGCAFLRAGLSGVVTWVPRVNRDRSQLCGFQPTVLSPDATIAANAAAIADAPMIEVAAPVADVATDVGMPIETVASLTTPPERMPVAPLVSPRIIDVPAPIAPVPVAIPHMTMAEICADVSATGHRYMNAATGVAVRCGPQTQPVSPAEPFSAPAMVNLGGEVISLAQLCQISDATGNRYLNAATGIPVRCGPQLESPSGLTAPLGQSMVAQAPLTPLATPAVVPPPATVAQAPIRLAPVEAVSPPPGYEAVWDDGRLNPNRGLPAVQASVNVSAMNLPQPVATGHRYVQVGTFGDPANADRTAARLQALGLPVGFATVTRNGRQLRVVAAGPFGDAATLQSALEAARSAGFADAFTRS